MADTGLFTSMLLGLTLVLLPVAVWLDTQKKGDEDES